MSRCYRRGDPGGIAALNRRDRFDMQVGQRQDPVPRHHHPQRRPKPQPERPCHVQQHRCVGRLIQRKVEGVVMAADRPSRRGAGSHRRSGGPTLSAVRSGRLSTWRHASSASFGSIVMRAKAIWSSNPGVSRGTVTRRLPCGSSAPSAASRRIASRAGVMPTPRLVDQPLNCDRLARLQLSIQDHVAQTRIGDLMRRNLDLSAFSCHRVPVLIKLVMTAFALQSSVEAVNRANNQSSGTLPTSRGPSCHSPPCPQKPR